MKKGILSFTVVLAFAIVNVLGCFSAAAVDCVGNTHVTPYSYYNTIKTVIVDDDFEDRKVEANLKDDTTKYAKPAVGNDQTVVAADSNGNKYLKLNGWQKIYAKPTNGTNYGINSDKLVFSFDITNPAALAGTTSSDTPNPVLYVGGKPFFRFNLKETDKAKGVEVRYFSGGGDCAFKKVGTNDDYWTQARASNDSWSHVELVLKRVEIAGSYTVELESLTANGTVFNLVDGVYAAGTPNFEKMDWWSNKSQKEDFIRLGNTGKEFVLDNVLIYAPGAAVSRVSTASNAAPAKTLYIDDDFNDRSAGNDVKSSNSKRIPYTNGVVAEQVTTNDMCATPSAAWKTMRLFSANNLGCDKLAFHFKYKLGTPTEGENVISLNFGMTNEYRAINAMKFGSTITYFGTEQIALGNAQASADDWTYIDAVFEKRTSGEGYDMFLNKLDVNGVSVDISATNGIAVQSAAKKWWGNDNDNFSSYFFQFGALEICIDDVMLYEPATITTGFEIANFNNGTVTIRNANAAALDLTDSKLIVAAYDNEDNLLGAVANTIGAYLASGESTSVSIAGVTAPTGTAYYKFFAWNNLNDMVPLFTQAEVTAK